MVLFTLFSEIGSCLKLSANHVSNFNLVCTNTNGLQVRKHVIQLCRSYFYSWILDTPFLFWRQRVVSTSLQSSLVCHCHPKVGNSFVWKTKQTYVPFNQIQNWLILTSNFICTADLACISKKSSFIDLRIPRLWS